jgi:hypothetical protein
MEWAQQTHEQPPTGIEERHVERRTPCGRATSGRIAQAIFGSCGTTIADRQARRVARWLRRMRPDAVSREEIRREALCQTVDADTAEDLIERLQRYGALRPTAVGNVRRRGRTSGAGRSIRTSGRISAISASALPTRRPSRGLVDASFLPQGIRFAGLP